MSQAFGQDFVYSSWELQWNLFQLYAFILQLMRDIGRILFWPSQNKHFQEKRYKVNSKKTVKYWEETWNVWEDYIVSSHLMRLISFQTPLQTVNYQINTYFCNYLEILKQRDEITRENY